jgi:hypothetical protein
VSESFKMNVPIYFELADGRVTRLGQVTMVGNSTAEKTVPLAKPPAPIKRVSIDYMHDVLAIESQ